MQSVRQAQRLARLLAGWQAKEALMRWLWQFAVAVLRLLLRTPLILQTAPYKHQTAHQQTRQLGQPYLQRNQQTLQESWSFLLSQSADAPLRRHQLSDSAQFGMPAHSRAVHLGTLAAWLASLALQCRSSLAVMQRRRLPAW